MSKHAKEMKAITRNLSTMTLGQVRKAISKVVAIMHTGAKGDRYSAKKLVGVLNARLNTLR